MNYLLKKINLKIKKWFQWYSKPGDCLSVSLLKRSFAVGGRRDVSNWLVNDWSSNDGVVLAGSGAELKFPKVSSSSSNKFLCDCGAEVKFVEISSGVVFVCDDAASRKA